MTMTASLSSRSESGDLVASGRARRRVDVDCRVDQDKGLISIVENKLAASSQEEGGRERGGGRGRVHWPSLAIWEAAVRKADADGAGWDGMDLG